jgi:lipoyl(octanoyl) transferase
MDAMWVKSESVCVFVFRHAGEAIEYLVLRRRPARGGFWQSVSGHVRGSESAAQAARREVIEETGLAPTRVVLLEKVNVFFIPGDECVHLEPCFGAEVEAGDAILSEEHEEQRWVGCDQAIRLIAFDGVREALRELDDRLAGRAPALPRAGAPSPPAG